MGEGGGGGRGEKTPNMIDTKKWLKIPAILRLAVLEADDFSSYEHTGFENGTGEYRSGVGGLMGSGPSSRHLGIVYLLLPSVLQCIFIFRPTHKYMNMFFPENRSMRFGF